VKPSRFWETSKVVRSFEVFFQTSKDLIFSKRSFSDLEGFEFLKEDTEKPSRFLETYR
jgi:hypothetical protein